MEPLARFVYFGSVTPICCILLLLWAVGGRAETGPAPEPAPTDAPSESPAPNPQPQLDLERLLRIPPGGVATPDLRGGKDRETWEAEFAEAHGEVRELKARIAETQQELRELAPDDWAFTPTGGGVPSDPETLKLRADLRRDRQSLEAARQRLRELQVEASLAGVPDVWKVTPEPAE